MDSGEYLARFYQHDLMAARQYVVDAYACTHPDVSTRRGIQTTALCLMTMDLYLNCGQSVADGSLMHQEMMRAGASGFTALRRPPVGSCPTYRVLAKHSGRDGAAVARGWAAAVWDAWAPHHAQVREWNIRWVPERVSGNDGR